MNNKVGEFASWKGSHNPEERVNSIRNIRLGIGNLGVKDLARAKQSLEKRQCLYKMTDAQGDL